MTRIELEFYETMIHTMNEIVEQLKILNEALKKEGNNND